MSEVAEPTFYVIFKNEKSHFNILYEVEENKRRFTTPSLMYRLLGDNFDLTEEICKKVTTMQSKDVMKDVQQCGRYRNRALRKSAMDVFNRLNMDQEEFEKGFDWVCGTDYSCMTEQQQKWYLDIIEEAFFTKASADDFYQFIRDAAEGSMIAKRNFTELLSDIIIGIDFHDRFYK